MLRINVKLLKIDDIRKNIKIALVEYAIIKALSYCTTGLTALRKTSHMFWFICLTRNESELLTSFESTIGIKTKSSFES